MSDDWFPDAVTDDDGAIVGEGITIIDPLGDSFALEEVKANDNGDLYGVVEGSGASWGGWKTFNADELNRDFTPAE